jgi:FtsZ-binding cell division protein ZapB
MFKNLCVGLDTNEKLQKQLDESRKENARLRQKKNEWHDKYLRLQTKTSKS